VDGGTNWESSTDMLILQACLCSVAQLCPILCERMNYTDHQAPLSMGFSGQEYWNGLPFPSPGDLLDPAVEPVSLGSPELAGEFFTTVPPGGPVRDNVSVSQLVCL